jgi:hypothetical protein
MSNTVAINQTRGSIAGDIYVHALTSAYANGYRLYDPSYPTSNEPDIWEVFRRDPVILSGINQRLSGIVTKGWTCVPDGDRPIDKRAARVMRDLLKKVQNFMGARRELACASILGRAYQYIETQRQWLRVADVQVKLPWLIPTRLRDVDRRRVHYKPVLNRDAKTGAIESISVAMMLWNVARGVWAEVTDPSAWVKVIYNDEEGRLGHGHGLMEAMYFYSYAKGIVLKEGLTGLKRWAQGLPVVGIDGARDTDKNTPNTVVRDAWLETFDAMQAENGFVHDKADEFNVIWPSGEGHRQVMDHLEYFDSAITRLLTGSIRPSGGAVRATGHGGQAETEADTSATIYEYDRDLLSENLTRDLIGFIWRSNQINFKLIGLSEANMPLYEQTDRPNENYIENSTVLTAARRDLKLEVLKSEAYEKLGLTMPSDGDEVLEALQDPASPFGAPGDPNAMPGEPGADPAAATPEGQEPAGAGVGANDDSDLDEML